MPGLQLIHVDKAEWIFFKMYIQFPRAVRYNIGYGSCGHIVLKFRTEQLSNTVKSLI